MNTDTPSEDFNNHYDEAEHAMFWAVFDLTQLVGSVTASDMVNRALDHAMRRDEIARRMSRASLIDSPGGNETPNLGD
jgi:hypothetical protein